jgi:hypothetical protein
MAIFALGPHNLGLQSPHRARQTAPPSQRRSTRNAMPQQARLRLPKVTQSKKRTATQPVHQGETEREPAGNPDREQQQHALIPLPHRRTPSSAPSPQNAVRPVAANSAGNARRSTADACAVLALHLASQSRIGPARQVVGPKQPIRVNDENPPNSALNWAKAAHGTQYRNHGAIGRGACTNMMRESSELWEDHDLA